MGPGKINQETVGLVGEIELPLLNYFGEHSNNKGRALLQTLH